MNDSTILWWYASDNQKYGPYSETQLRELAQAGEVRAGDLIWHHGLENWVPATSIDGLIPPKPILPPELPVPSQTEPPSPVQETPHWQDVLLHHATASLPTLDAEPMAVFVGPNYGFYARRWAQAERFGGMISWNWAAFFLGLFWLAYRKMYLYCGVVIALALFMTGMAQAMRIPPEQVQLWQMYIAPIFSMLMGFFGNWLYRLHAERKIRQITASSASNPQLTPLLLAQQGGASLVSVLAVIAVMMMASIFGSMIAIRLLGITP